MGNSKQRQLIILAVVLLAATVFVYRAEPTVAVQKPVRLETALQQVAGYPLLASAEVSDDIAAFLELDDYTQATYQGPSGPVSLYIGYYYGLAKLSAAHSPLVCFPGQGWQLQEHTERTVQVGPHPVHYAEMVAELGDRQELVLYWYQADQKTNPQIYRNKLSAFINAVSGGSEEHAFVRVTVPFREGERDLARSAGEAFITSFYPVFLEYVSRRAEPAPTTS